MTLNATIRGAISGAILAISAAMLASPQATQAQPVRAKAGLVLVDPRDGNAARNINNVLTLYQMMINENKALEGTAKLLTPGYVQHNPLIADGSAALGKYFAGVKAAHQRRGCRWRRHRQDERRRKGRRALGCAGASWRSEKFGPMGRAEHPSRQSERHVLKTR